MHSTYLLAVLLFCSLLDLTGQIPQAREVYRTSISLFDLHVVDIDGDGDKDIVGAFNSVGPINNRFSFGWMENVGGDAGYVHE